MNKQLNGKALDQLIAAQYQLLTEENKAKVNRLVARLADPAVSKAIAYLESCNQDSPLLNAESLATMTPKEYLVMPDAQKKEFLRKEVERIAALPECEHDAAFDALREAVMPKITDLPVKGSDLTYGEYCQKKGLDWRTGEPSRE